MQHCFPSASGDFPSALKAQSNPYYNHESLGVRPTFPRLFVCTFIRFQSIRGETVIELIIHYPETPEQQALFDARVARFHAEYVAQYIEKLDCPTQQKLQLIDAIAQTILERCEGKAQR